MKCTIPEISWHNRDPVLSLHIQPTKGNESFYRLATGGTDSHVLIWLLSVAKGGVASVECAADLTRHTKPVNCVRFSPSGSILASGDDEACIILWKMKKSNDPPELFKEEGESFKEQWTSVKVLRGHLQDVYDLSWSADSKHLISGSVDNTAILWNVSSGKNLGILTEHKGFVQGVAWDPNGQYVATISSDRVCRVYNAVTRKVQSKIYKGHLPGTSPEPESKPAHYFHDDTLKSFFRRLTFTPDGQLLIVPSGLVEELDKKSTHCTILFHRNCLQKPIAFLPSLSQYSVAVSCCPVFFTLRQMDFAPLFQLPYRIVIAVATQSNVMLYDTQHAAPFALITNIHYTRLTDLSWSSDGRVLVVSSSDGYCSIITFAENELGTIYTKEDNQTPENELTKSQDNTLKTPLQKSDVPLNLTEEANMCFEAKGKIETKLDDSKSKIPSKDKETPMDIDEFSLVYEGTITEPALESKSYDSNKVKEGENLVVESESSTKEKAKDCHDLPVSNPIEEESPKKNCEPTKTMQEEALTSPKSGVNITPGNTNKKTPRRVQLITLSSPKSRKKLLE
ncbi:chromatin assembly factor 1 subunit B [Macrosteles quadrilineatus]|uniref:chromatin assembly factor 1 subunit B n=1 Tax=Macrosteles quadrilineatus TaxID=74068 RepID=UPI0023E0F944|nr:chromatin assembly factor 1 subunit B [Macrosteles quadrilineatus]